MAARAWKAGSKFVALNARILAASRAPPRPMAPERALLDVWRTSGPEMSLVNCATLLLELGRHGARPPADAVRRAAALAVHTPPGREPRAVASVIHALSRAAPKDREASWTAVERVAIRGVADFSGADLSVVARASAARGGGRLLDAVVREAAARGVGLEPAHAAQIVWAAGHVDSRAGADDLNRLARRLEEAVASLGAGHLVMACVGLCRRPGEASGAFFRAARPAAVDVAAMAPPARLHEAASLAWAFAKAGDENADEVAAASANALRRATVPKAPMQPFSMILWAVARTRARGWQELLMDVGECASRRGPAADEAALGLLLLAYARMPVSGKEVLRALEPAVLRRMPSMGPATVANAAWAFARALPDDAATVVHAAATWLAPRAAGCRPEELAKSAWAVGRCARAPAAFRRALAQEVRRRPAAFTPQELSHVAWGLANTGSVDMEVISAIAGEVLLRPTAFNDLDMHSIATAVARIDGEGPPSEAIHAAFAAVAAARAEATGLDTA